MNATPQFPPWSAPAKAVFRVCCIFFVLYVFLNGSEIFPLSNPVFDLYITPFHHLIPWIGQHILHLPYAITTFSNGSLDTIYDYVMLFFIVCCSLVGGLAWTIADRRSREYHVLLFWLNVCVRFFCAWSMFSFGFSKAYKLQFGFPSNGSLVQPLGSFSPMHLAWSFFGYSSGYSYLAGWAEIISGVLLCFRRTTRIGAILFLAVMSNVMAINYFYDVCLKQTSTIMVIMGLFLLLQERKRLINFFFRNKWAAPEVEWKPQFSKKGINIAISFCIYAATAFVIFNINRTAIGLLKDFSDDRPKPALYGIFNVESFIRNHDTLPPLLTDTTRWRRIVINDQGSYGAAVSIRMMNDSAKTYYLTPDSVKKTFAIYRRPDTANKAVFAYHFAAKDTLIASGVWKKDSLTIIFKEIDPEKFTLVKRGFHLINEYPYQW